MNPVEYFLIFFKASLFSSGGLANLPSLHQDLLANGWAEDADFGKAVAVGQLTPGPNGLWVISLGYLTYGLAGVLLALTAITIPPFAVLILAAFHRRIEHRPAVQGIMRGMSLAVVGLVLVVAASLANGPNMDWRSWLIGLVAFGLTLSGRVHVVVVLGLAAGAGLVMFG